VAVGLSVVDGLASASLWSEISPFSTLHRLLRACARRLSQDQHDDDDEKDEANEAAADVQTRCEQHGIAITQTGDTANRGESLRHVAGGYCEYTLPQGNPHRKLNIMDKDLDQAKGRIKQAAGDLTGNDRLKKEGKADETAGKAKEFLGNAKDKADDMIDKARDRVDNN
jgi:uncharacterized protein YjbJ (UPF0337 family)